MRHLGFSILLLLASVTGGCTLLDEPMFDGVRIVSGIGPYRDQGGVEVCVADHRLGTPDTDLAGFCVPRTAPLRATCTDDAGCRSRESCVCGYCTVKYCTRNDECGEGRACDFTLSRCVTKCSDECDCQGPNGRCDIGMCQQLCIVNAECQSGEICSLSRARCISVPCSNDADCFPEESCVIQREPRRFTEPSVLEDPDTGGVIVYFDMVHAGAFERQRHMIFRAITTDGREWRVDPAAPILVPDIPDDYRAPTVIKGAAGYLMYFERGAGDGIMRAVSTDGRAWTIDPPTPVILPDGPFDAGMVKAPAAVIGPDGLPRIYYETGDARSIGLVVAQDYEGRLFPSGSARQQVLTLAQVESEVLWRGLTRIRSPYVTLDQDWEGNPMYRLWFSARGFESSEGSSFGSVEQIPANYSIGYAASLDGVGFEVFPYNPVFDRIYPNTFVNHASELTPAVLDRGDHYLLFYSSADRSGGSWENIRVAINPPPFGNE